MRPQVVVDIGNSRIKWGLCSAEGGILHSLSLPEDPNVWKTNLDQLAAHLDRPGRPLKEGAGPPPLAGRRPASDTIRRPDAASPLMRSARWPSEMR